MANNSINEIKEMKISTITDRNFGWKDIQVDLKDAGGRVEILIDGVVYKAPIDENGKWSFTPPAGWDEGLHTVQLITIDKAGNRSPANSNSYIVNLDTQAPEAPEIWRVVDNTGSNKGNLNPGEITDELKPVISGVAEPNSIVYLYDNGGKDPIASVKTNSMGAWTITPELADGEHSLTVVAKDAGKHESPASEPFVVVVEAGAVVKAEGPTTELQQSEEPVVGTQDFGTFKNGWEGYTKKNYIEQSGTGEANAEIQITLNNEVYVIRANDKGEWKFKSDELPDGTYFYQHRVRDKAHNWGAPTQVILHVEAEAPEAPQILRVIDDEGNVDHLTSGQYTDDKNPTLSGVAKPGSLVFIYGADSAPIGSVTAGGDGRWTFTPELTTDDTYIFNVAYQDRYGRMSPKSDNFILRLDATAPEAPSLEGVYDDVGRVTGELKSGDTTDDTTLSLSGKADAGSIVRIWDGEKVVATVIANSRGEWSYELDVAEGKHALRVDSVSKGGAASAPSEEFIVIVDTQTLPPAQIEEIVANNGAEERPLVSGDATNDDTPVLRGSGEEGEIVYVYDKDKVIGSATVGKDGKWEIELDPLEEGSHELKIKIEDPKTGKSSDFSDPVTIVVDLTAPEKPVAPGIVDNTGDEQGVIQPGTPTDETQPEFTGGGATPGDVVEIIIIDEDGKEQVIGSGVVDEKGDWTVTPTDPIGDGEYDVVVEITDPAGNTSDRSDPIELIIDTKMPGEIKDFELWDDVGAITGQILDGGVTDDKSPTVRGTGENGSKVIIYDGDKQIGSATVVDGKWSFDLPALTEGAHNIRVQPVSASGVKGPINEGINFDVDLTAPQAGTYTGGTFIDVDGYPRPIVPDINGQVMKLNGTGKEDGTVVVVYGDAARTEIIGSAVVTNGKWTLDTKELAEGSYHISFGYRDAAGNEVAGEESFDVNVDVTPPEPIDPGDLFPDSFNEALMSMSLTDILSMSDDSLFIDNGKTQLMISDSAQEVTLQDILPEGEDVNNWSQANGTVTVAGVEYNVYQNNGGDAEVMVPQHLLQEQQH